MSLIIYFINAQNDRGPGKLIHNLLKGLDQLRIDYKCNESVHKISDQKIYCPQNHPILNSAFIGRMTIGPNICVLPIDNALVMEQKYKKIIVPSQWVSDLYSKWISPDKIALWAVGIDTDKFHPINALKQYDCLLYFKRRTEDELNKAIEILTKFKQSYYVLKYGDYNEEDFITLITSCRYSFILNNSESQGISTLEIMSCDCPVFVWDVEFWYDRGDEFIVSATSVPYWADQCGVKATDNIERNFEIFLNNLNRYHPRNFIETDFTLAKKSQALVSILEDNSQEVDSGNYSVLQELLLEKIWTEGKPLRLHLGCGENHFEGYINIDYRLSEHTVQTASGADFFADITTLAFPAETVDEIRLHHVFEHFDRATALAMLIKWNRWLKIGGKIHIETPDFIGNIKTLLSNPSWLVKMGIIRHIVGSHEASWAYHVDQWFAERFEHTLRKLGFDNIQIEHVSWQREPYLSNVHAIARKSRQLTLNELLQSADELLWESTVSPNETTLHEVWKKQLREAINKRKEVRAVKSDVTDLSIDIEPFVGLIFSKDRAMQLDATLRSFQSHCKDPEIIRLKVLYTTSSSVHQSQYNFLTKEYPSVDFVRENNFKNNLLSLLPFYKYVLFLVDDNIFVRDFSLSDIMQSVEQNPQSLGFSLRLGRNTSYCYPLNKEQCIPDFQTVSHKVLKYNWATAECDFGYPLEVSSSVYRLKDILPFIASLQFSNPNTLEAMMDNNRTSFQNEKPFLQCYEQSVTFCAPANIVQSSWSNRASNKAEYSVDNLAGLFEEGLRIDVGSFNDFMPNACHQEVQLKFINSLPASQPLVSVIIPCYKLAQYLPDAVGSVIGQTCQDWECIIVNDGSPDNTSEVATEIIKANPSRNIILLEKKNGGVSDARNYGIGYSKGRYILPLDSDDMIHPEMLSKTVGFLQMHPEISVAYTDHVHFIDTNRYRVVPVPEHDSRQLLVQNCFAYCSLFRRNVWETVGGYSRNMIWGYEDWDFWLGCYEKGCQMRRVPEPLFFYRLQETSRSSTARHHDSELKAQIILNHDVLFGQNQVAWAKGIQNGEPWAMAIKTTQAFIPSEDLISSNIPVGVLAKLEMSDDSFSSGNFGSAAKRKKEALNLAPDDLEFLSTRENICLQLLESQDNKFNNVYKENLQFVDKYPFITCAMFTPNKPEFFEYADRLALSCEKYKLPYTIYIVPEIHKSLSPAGKDDPYFTRTNLIYYNLLRFPEKNILCLDADMFFMDYPDRFVEISDSGYDLAVYNWLNDKHNEAYIPVNRKIEAGNRHSDLYMFSHCIGFFSSEQLFCSGGVQFYRNSLEAKYLLELWQALIVSYPDYAEDQCLDFVYNNFILHQRNLKAYWLDKSYLRFPWWPHVKPVIIHPGLPSGGRSRQLNQINNRQHFYVERCLPKNWNEMIFPRDCVIDTKEHALFRIVNNQLVDPRPIQQEFWIYPDEVRVEGKAESCRQGSDHEVTSSGISGKQAASAKTLKVGRNAPCPCGSGKKYKKCCGRN